MIKREKIKQAIDAIARRDPEIAYTLDEMLSTGMITVPSPDHRTSMSEDFSFFFANEKVPINKFLYLNEDTVPIEQRLLIKYGELVKKRELREQGGPSNYLEAAGDIHMAGLRLMVDYEIDYAIDRLRKHLKTLEMDKRPASATRVATKETLSNASTCDETIRFYEVHISFLEKMKLDRGPRIFTQADRDPDALYQGLVNESIPALFMHFPICMDSLLQVADIDIEFFHVRFLLNCLVKGLGKNVLACVVDNRIVGLIYITFKERMFHKCLEIKFMATLRGKNRNEELQKTSTPRGVGTLLVAGVWLLWKTEFVKAKELQLDAEIGARRFYDALGFRPRGLSKYTLKNPRGNLLRAIVIMANNCQYVGQGVINEITTLIRKQTQSLSKKARSEKEKSARQLMVASTKECLKSGSHPDFTKAALDTLLKCRAKIPESKNLIQYALENASDELKDHIEHAAGACC